MLFDICFICERKTLKIGLNGIKGWRYWKVGGKKVPSQFPSYFSRCAPFIRHHFCRAEAGLALFDGFPRFALSQ